MKFPDHFSGHSSQYAASRPHYPDSLFPYLASICSRTECAWDCATGSGQAAFALAPFFTRVIATDASEAQIEHPSGSAANVDFHAAPAEASGIDTDSVDLITVAQALHWFRFEEFFGEVNRVARPDGLLAVWSYGLTRVTSSIDELVDGLYLDIDKYWPPERLYVENNYSTIPFPFEIVPTPEFEMNLSWSADQMLDYLRTWSAVKRCEKDTGLDPVAKIEAPFREAWGEDRREVCWPLFVKVGRGAK
ncbi:MAG: class I SAM-dependent methyltransferase [Verrucomicrobiales bacterium]|nr:class I SAM-dependent methyltransferase [Verrucomicrobiales bacterium]